MTEEQLRVRLSELLENRWVSEAKYYAHWSEMETIRAKLSLAGPLRSSPSPAKPPQSPDIPE